MKKVTRSILQEISQFVPQKTQEEQIEARAHHIITSAINLLESIEKTYSPEDAEQLTKRFLSSIKGSDPNRFIRMIRKVKDGKTINDD